MNLKSLNNDDPLEFWDAIKKMGRKRKKPIPQ